MKELLWSNDQKEQNINDLWEENIILKQENSLLKDKENQKKSKNNKLEEDLLRELNVLKEDNE